MPLLHCSKESNDSFLGIRVVRFSIWCPHSQWHQRKLQAEVGVEWKLAHWWCKSQFRALVLSVICLPRIISFQSKTCAQMRGCTRHPSQGIFCCLRSRALQWWIPAISTFHFHATAVIVREEGYLFIIIFMLFNSLKNKYSTATD